MDKKDILEKAQKENKKGDEMYNYFYRRGAQFAMVAGLIVCVIGMLVDLVVNSRFTELGYFMAITQTAMNFALHLFTGVKSKDKTNIIIAVLNGIAMVAFIAALICYMLNL